MKKIIALTLTLSALNSSVQARNIPMTEYSNLVNLMDGKGAAPAVMPAVQSQGDIGPICGPARKYSKPTVPPIVRFEKERGVHYGWNLIMTPARWTFARLGSLMLPLLIVLGLGLALLPLAFLTGTVTEAADIEGDIPKFRFSDSSNYH